MPRVTRVYAVTIELGDTAFAVLYTLLVLLPLRLKLLYLWAKLFYVMAKYWVL